jgi:putative Holliday junction resolvase
LKGNGKGDKGNVRNAGASPNRDALPVSRLPFPARTGTVLAFDYGERYVGVAVGEGDVRVAHPLTTIETRAATVRLAAIAALVDEWRPGRLVVGLPLGLEGERHELTGRAERFACQLEARFRLPVALVDERLTSAEAEGRLAAIGRGGRKHKRLAHPVSAQVILQDYFDRDAAP